MANNSKYFLTLTNYSIIVKLYYLIFKNIKINNNNYDLEDSLIIIYYLFGYYL